jgi:hypothetical protein
MVANMSLALVVGSKNKKTIPGIAFLCTFRWWSGRLHIIQLPHVCDIAIKEQRRTDSIAQLPFFFLTFFLSSISLSIISLYIHIITDIGTMQLISLRWGAGCSNVRLWYDGRRCLNNKKDEGETSQSVAGAYYREWILFKLDTIHTQFSITNIYLFVYAQSISIPSSNFF